MKAFVAAAGTIFGLIVVAHIWRMLVEPHVARDPVYWLITATAAALSAWAWLALLRSRRSRP